MADEVDAVKEARKRERSGGTKKAPRKGREAGKAKSKPGGGDRHPAAPILKPGSRLGEAERKKLRDRLSRAKERMLGKTGPASTPSLGAGTRAGLPNGEEDVESVHSSSGYSPSLADDALHTGGSLIDVELGQQALSDRPKTCRAPRRQLPQGDTPGEQVMKKKKKRRSVGKAPLMLEDKGVTNVGTSTNLQSQLVRRAAESSQKKKEAKKDSHKSPGKQLLKILTTAINPKKKKKKKRGEGSEDSTHKKKKKNKSKKVKKEPGDPSDHSSSSPTSSSGNSSGDNGEESESSSHQGRYEPPLKKKAMEKPGSVLKMLISHARAQLDQTSKVTVNPEEADLTKGIKLTSYLTLVVRPQLTGGGNLLRELHLLANGLDMLRGGQLASLGDLMASRFMALHQSAIDGNWTAARHLEVLPLEEVSAAGAAVVLRARRHAKLQDKVNNVNQAWWSSAGKGKAGKGKGPATEEWRPDGKGKSKKGDRPKGKGKSWWGNSPLMSQEGKDAHKAKEKPGEK